MNTPRQPNVRTPLEQIPGQVRHSADRTPVPTSFSAAFMPDSKPATAKDGTAGSVATVRITGTLRLRRAVADALHQRT
jgi:hypothetical protein